MKETLPENKYRYAYPRPALTVDAMLFHYHQEVLKILLICRKDEPYKDRWAFPGGFVNEGETVEEAIYRELEEETGLRIEGMEQVFAASAPGRDPRGWTVSVIFLGFLTGEYADLKAGDDAADAAWHPVTKLPELAFDHDDIVDKVRGFLRNKIKTGGILRHLLPQTFRKNELITLLRSLYNTDNEIESIVARLLSIRAILPAGEDIFSLS